MNSCIFSGDNLEMRSRFTQRITSHTGIRQYSSHWINRIQNIRNSYYIQYILFSTYLANSDYHNAHSVKCSVMQHHITFLCLSLKNVSVSFQLACSIRYIIMFLSSRQDRTCMEETAVLTHASRVTLAKLCLQTCISQNSLRGMDKQR